MLEVFLKNIAKIHNADSLKYFFRVWKYVCIKFFKKVSKQGKMSGFLFFIF